MVYMINLFKLKNNSRLQRKDTYFKYSKEEQFTGEYWIDGKKIYKKSLQTSVRKISTGNSNINVANLGDFRTFDLPHCLYIRDSETYITGGTNDFSLGTINSSGFFNGLFLDQWRNDTRDNVWITVLYTRR